MAKKNGNDFSERIKILEKALSNLADTLKKSGAEFDADMQDIFTELKALKVFLSRNMPDFKKQFPEIRRKIK